MHTRALSVALSLSLTLVACQPDELSDYDEDWGLNDDAEDGRQIFASCPNGGKVNPATPAFGKAIDAYASYDGQDACSGSAKPGVTAFMNLILKTYPCTHSGGIVRGCGVGGTSEHKEGRAWDWMITPSNPASTQLLNWLLATDSHGNKHANARRVGIMYMIFNRKMWRAYSPGSGWQAYTGSNPHTDHVHFSFSWKGANKQTSFWSAPAPAPAPAPTPTNDPPKGKLEQASCTGGVKGWAQDPNAPKTAIAVHLYFDKTADAAGATATTVKANVSRADLCTPLGSCEHGFKLDIPTGLRDGKKHTVYAYALDSASGKKALLSGSPMSFTCASSTPPAPPPADPAPANPPPTDPPADPAPADPAPPDASDTSSPAVDDGVVGGCSVASGADLSSTGMGLLALLALRLTSSRRRR
jgi:hypothetical protein